MNPGWTYHLNYKQVANIEGVIFVKRKDLYIKMRAYIQLLLRVLLMNNSLLTNSSCQNYTQKKFIHMYLAEDTSLGTYYLRLSPSMITDQASV